MMTLSALGFSEFFRTQNHTCAPSSQPARVTRVSGELCDVQREAGPLRVRIPRSLRRTEQGAPVVGDWVMVDGDNAAPHVEHVFQRRTRLVREAAGGRARIQIIAANVDLVFVVTGLDGDFNPRRIERYLALVADSGARAVVLLTKAGICSDVESKVARAKAVAPGVPVHAIDVLAAINAKVIENYLTIGETVVLVGSSGVGKSTLVNHLAAARIMATGAVRSGDDRGRHTTTHRQLLWLSNGAALVDNPGMRELRLWVDGDGLEEAFADVLEAMQACRFGNCSHEGEPGCGVADAIAQGALDVRRVESYKKLQGEIDATKKRNQKHESRAQDRRFSKHIKQALRNKRSRR